MVTLASLRSDRWTACPELVDDFIGLRNQSITQAKELWGAWFFAIAGGEPMVYRSQGKHLLDITDRDDAGLFLMYSNGTPIDKEMATRMGAAGAVNAIVAGQLSFAFWVGAVLIGMLLPLGTELSFIVRRVRRPSREVAIPLALMVLVGGLVLRAVIVFGGQM